MYSCCSTVDFVHRNREKCTCDNAWQPPSHFLGTKCGKFPWHCVTKLPNGVARHHSRRSFFGQHARVSPQCNKRRKYLKFCLVHIVFRYGYKGRRKIDLKSEVLPARWPIVTKSVQGPLHHCIHDTVHGSQPRTGFLRYFCLTRARV